MEQTLAADLGLSISTYGKSLESSALLDPGWRRILDGEFTKPYMNKLRKTLAKHEAAALRIFPPAGDVFNALQVTGLKQTKVVILGQDPYHGPSQAHGLSFSVPEGVKPPPSLVNIFRELQSDLGIPPPATGNLLPWARQGVLLLNATLTVESGKAGSHQGMGWEEFTDKVIEVLDRERENLVFILWGKYAQAKAAKVDRGRHLVIQSPHPSPFSAYTGFFGSRPFSQTNQYLDRHGVPVIDWRLSH